MDELTGNAARGFASKDSFFLLFVKMKWNIAKLNLLIFLIL